MPRLIDADNLLEQIQWLEVDAPVFHDVWEEICSQPTVDAVRHGHWEDCSNGWMCSACHHDVSKETVYCPNCGAKMDESKGETKDVEFVEVVRCKDCQYYYEQPRGFSPICELTRSRTEKEGFCAWAERKEDE